MHGVTNAIERLNNNIEEKQTKNTTTEGGEGSVVPSWIVGCWNLITNDGNHKLNKSRQTKNKKEGGLVVSRGWSGSAGRYLASERRR